MTTPQTQLETDLAGFVAAINADPTNWHQLGVLGDFLQDREEGLPSKWRGLAPGFLALAHHQVQPWWFAISENWGFWANSYSVFVPAVSKCSLLARWWLYEVTFNKHVMEGANYIYTQEKKPKNHNGFVLLKAVARAFEKLSPDVRERIMRADPGDWDAVTRAE